MMRLSPVIVPAMVLRERAVIQADIPLLFHHLARFYRLDMACAVSKVLTADAEIIILSELAENPGPSIASSVGSLIPDVFKKICSRPPECVEFWEHTSARSHSTFASINQSQTFIQINHTSKADSIFFSGYGAHHFDSSGIDLSN